MTQRSTIQAGKLESVHKTEIFIVYLPQMDENTDIEANTGKQKLKKFGRRRKVDPISRAGSRMAAR
jgi:hypothetical protein